MAFREKMIINQSFYAFLIIFFFILSPYFNLNGVFVHGGLIGVILILLKTTGSFFGALRNYYLLRLLMLFGSLLVLYSLSITIEGKQTQGLMIFPELLLKVSWYVLSGILLGFFFQKSGQDVCSALTKYVNFIILTGLTNAFIILAVFFIPEFKLFVENFLFQGLSNINYLESHRPRGLASAGGASLSVFHAIATFCLFWMFMHKRIHGLIFLIGILPLIFSTILIGRTGIIILLIAILFIVFYALLSLKLSHISKAVSFLLISVALGFMVHLFLPDVVEPKIYNHMIGFLFSGWEGIEKEGSVNSITNFYHLPDSLLHLLIGVGDFSGSFELRSTADSGYMKTFTAVGFIGSLIMYGGVILWSWLVIKNVPLPKDANILLIFSLFLLLIFELKEPSILQGYASRFFWLMLGLILAYRPLDYLSRLSLSKNT